MHFSNFLQLFSLMNKPGLWRKCENKRTMSNIYNNDISNSGNCYNCLYQNKQTPYFFPPVREKQNPPLLKLIWLAICLVFGSDRLIPHFWPHLGKKKKPTNQQTHNKQRPKPTHTQPQLPRSVSQEHTRSPAPNWFWPQDTARHKTTTPGHYLGVGVLDHCLFCTTQRTPRAKAVPGAPALQTTPSRGLDSLGASPSIARWFEVYWSMLQPLPLCPVCRWTLCHQKGKEFFFVFFF